LVRDNLLRAPERSLQKAAKETKVVIVEFKTSSLSSFPSVKYRFSFPHRTDAF
jgi:hypothetical protein